jgi:hypothetical protein
MDHNWLAISIGVLTAKQNNVSEKWLPSANPTERPTYEPGGVEVPCFKPDGTRASMLEFMLRENEQVVGLCYKLNPVDP